VEGTKCLVLGGGGFIGTNLCRELRARGALVRGFGRSRQFADALDGVEWVFGDLNDADCLEGLIRGIDIVFHLIGSGLPNSSNTHPADDVIDSIRGTVLLLDACRGANIRKIVYVSSGGTVYGVTGDRPIAETMPTDPICAYGIGKLTIEKYFSLYGYLYGMNFSVLRVANPYGRFQTANRQQGVIAALLKRAIRGEKLEIWGDGSVTRDFLHVDDVVAAMLAVVDYDGPHHVFNVGSGVGRSLRTIVGDIAAVLRRDDLPIAYQDARPADVPVNVLDIGLIRQQIGWLPRVEWMSGLERTAAWLRENL
jgi:UDP-glucose 4-epimerase